MINALNPPRSDAPFALLDVAGGTGDIAFRAAKAAGAGFQATVCDINSDMLEVGRERAAARHLDDQVSFVEGNAEALAFPDRAFDAYTIAFGIRNVPRIDLALSEALSRAEARQPFPVPGIFHRRRARARSDLRSVFVQGDPAARPRRDRRCRVLSVSRRIDPQISQAERVRRDDPRRRLSRASTGRACPAASWRCIRAGVCDFGDRRISRGWPAPVLCSRAKACSAWSIRAWCRRPGNWRCGSRG